MSIIGISLFGSEHLLSEREAILNGGLKLLCC